MAPALCATSEFTSSREGSAAGARYQRQEPRQMLALWLTQEETEALILLCAASPAATAQGEETLFGKLGEIFRAFAS